MQKEDQLNKLILDLFNFKAQQGLRSAEIIYKYDMNNKGYLNQQEFTQIFRNFKQNCDELAGQLFLRLQQKYGRINEICLRDLAARLSKQQPKQLESRVQTPQEIFRLVCSLLKERGILIKDHFKQFDVNKNNKLDVSELNKFIKSLIPELNEKEYFSIIRYLSQEKQQECFEISLFGLMKVIQQEDHKINIQNQPEGYDQRSPIKLLKQRSNQDRQVLEQQEANSQQFQREINRHNTAQQIKPSPSYEALTPQIIRKQKRGNINPILESNIYEDPTQANLLKSQIKFQDYVVFDRETIGIKQFITLFQQFKESNNQFKDLEFPASKVSIGPNEKLNQLNIEWKKPKEFWNEVTVFSKNIDSDRFGLGKWISPCDIIQGELGDCYLLSSLSSIACRWPETILSLFVTPKQNSAGIYCVRMCIDGVWKAIIVDDYFPTRWGQPCFSKSQTNELWVMILEKAWAKISGSYSNIISGTPREVIRSLTGCPTLSLRTESPEFLKDFENYVKTKCIMTSGSLSRQGNGLLKEAEKLGLVPGHAYSILKIREIIHPQKGQVKLIKLRNPWGKKEWRQLNFFLKKSGDWSDDSSLWTEELRQICRYSNKKDGTFFMDIKDFMKYFAHVDVGIFNENYEYKSYNHISKRKHGLYFTFQVKVPGEYYFSIIQSSQRYKKYKKKVNRVQKTTNENLEFLPAQILIGYSDINNNYKFTFAKKTSQAETSIGGYLKAGIYFMYLKLELQNQEEKQFVFVTYGKSDLQVKLIKKPPNFKIKCYEDKAKSNEDKKLYDNHKGIYSSYETKIDLGLGYFYFVNQGDSRKALDTQITLKDMKGIKFLKPQSGNQVKIYLEPGQSKCIMVSLDPKGFGYQRFEQTRFISQ